MIYDLVRQRLKFCTISMGVSVPLSVITLQPLIAIIGVVVIPIMLLYSLNWVKPKLDNNSQRSSE
jgi:hypothetical protein